MDIRFLDKCRYLIVGLNHTHLKTLIKSNKGRKTTRLAAMVEVSLMQKAYD